MIEFALFGAIWPFLLLMFISLCSAMYRNLRRPKRRKEYQKKDIKHLN